MVIFHSYVGLPKGNVDDNQNENQFIINDDSHQFLPVLPFCIDLEHQPTFKLREVDRIRAQKFDRMNEAPDGSAGGDV